MEVSSRNNSMDAKTDTLRNRIMPVLLYCQAKKGDLELYRDWDNHEDRNKKYFYTYYSGLFCRILCLLEMPFNVTDTLLGECEALLEKYHWYNLQDEDFEKFKLGGSHACEVPEALGVIDGIDDVVWNGIGNGRDVACLMQEHSIWEFSDVRGSVKLNK